MEHLESPAIIVNIHGHVRHVHRTLFEKYFRVLEIYPSTKEEETMTSVEVNELIWALYYEEIMKKVGMEIFEKPRIMKFILDYGINPYLILGKNGTQKVFAGLNLLNAWVLDKIKPGSEINTGLLDDLSKSVAQSCKSLPDGFLLKKKNIYICNVNHDFNGEFLQLYGTDLYKHMILRILKKHGINIYDDWVMSCGCGDISAKLVKDYYKDFPLCKD